MEKYDKEYSRPIDSLGILLLPIKRETDRFYKEYLLPDDYLNLTKIKRNILSNVKQPSHEIPKTLHLETTTCNKFAVNSCHYNSYKVIQSSTSNQENSIIQHQFERKILKRNKGVYHKVKSNESTYSCDIKYTKKYENIFNKQEYMNDFIKMDKNARKDKKEKRARLKVNDYVQYCDSNCTCSRNSHDFINIEGQKSRVTIFGQLGLTKDDQYVLNCGATVNDKPIRSNVTNVDNYNKWSSYRQETNDAETKTTQATQANFNFSTKTPNKNLKNKSVQCVCNSTQCPNKSFNSKEGFENIELKQCKSPLVVISVYPRQDSVEIDEKSNPIKVIRHHISTQNKMVSNPNVSKKLLPKEEKKPKTERTLIDTKSKLSKTRSPSPTSDTIKEKRKNTDIKLLGVGVNTKNQPTLRQKSPDKPVPKLSNTKRNIDNLVNYPKTIRHVGFGGKKQYDLRETNKEQVKKDIVNTFLKNIGKTDNNIRKKKLFAPKEDASKITIDIDGENEDYSLLLEQRNFDTGLCIRKRMKDQCQSGKKTENSRKLSLLSDSVANDDKRNRKYTRTNTRKPFVPKSLASESTLNVKDSIEVCHRREQRNSSRIVSKQTQQNVLSGPNKHYRGDNCSITDPIERDQEIRKLLGVRKEKQYKDREEPKINRPDNENGDYCDRTKWSKDFLIERNVPNFTLNKKLLKKGRREKVFSTEMQINYHETQKDNNLFVQTLKTKNDTKQEIALKNNIIKTSDDIIANDMSSISQNVFTSYARKENKIIISNIQIVLQLEKYSKSIILTKKQYEKLKRTIKPTLSKKLNETEKRKRYNINAINCNVVSIGTINIKRKQKQSMRFNRETQTENISKCVEIQYNSQFHNKLIHKENAGEINNNVFKTQGKTTNRNINPRQVISSMQIRCTNFEYIKQVSVSSQYLGEGAFNTLQHSNIQNDKNKSLHTIFKGHRKCVTPNLGTSTLSLNSNSANYSKYSIKPHHRSGDEKIKKPFLQRLMSCLIVMRSTRTPDFKEMANQRKLPSQNTSLDSYNISTSLGAIDMSSSIYDSSVSFHSNHSIIPINKPKRGFFNSVRGFLTIRRN